MTVFRPRRFILKGFKRYWFVCKDLQLLCYKSADDRKSGIPPHHKFNLKGCEVTPDVNLQQDKFGIRLEIPEDGGMTELCLRCDKVILFCGVFLMRFSVFYFMY